MAASERGSLRGKVALITGGTRGIGRAIARALLAQRCRVIITGRESPSRQRGRVVSFGCDVRDARAVQTLFATVKKRFQYIDILVNNAGIAHASLNTYQLPPDTWRDVIDTNLTGTFLVTHYALPLMRRGGIIANNLSIAAKRVFPGSSAYDASKHGALGFTNTLREELRSRGIRVIALLPGATDTEIWNTLWPEAPRKKMMSAETVASALVNALTLPANSTVEELVIMPAAGTL